MSAVDIAFLLGAAFVTGISWRNRRGILWISVAALSYINAAIAWRLHLPYAEAITGFGDAGVCLAIYFAGKYRWELWVWRLFQVSVAVSFLYLAGNLGIFARVPHDVYSTMLEVINWLLLLLIGGLSAVQWVGDYDAGAGRPWDRVRRAYLALRQARKTPPFWKA